MHFIFNFHFFFNRRASKSLRRGNVLSTKTTTKLYVQFKWNFSITNGSLKITGCHRKIFKCINCIETEKKYAVAKYLIIIQCHILFVTNFHQSNGMSVIWHEVNRLKLMKMSNTVQLKRLKI